MKKFRAFFLVAFAMLFVATSLTSCKKWKASRRLDGTWNATSYKVDGSEYIGGAAYFSSVEIRFAKDDKETGDVTITVISDFGTSVNSGTYQCNDDEIVFTFSDSYGTSIETYDMDLSKDEMTLTGNQDGYSVEISAEKE